MLTPHDLELIDFLHGGFPLSEHPFAEVGESLGRSEAAVLASLQSLLQRGYLTRFGPLFQIERSGGQFVLAALQAPPERFEVIAALVNALPEVAHNYRREHALNMWFVVGAESPQSAAQALTQIEAQTGLKVYAFPKEKEFFVELRLPLTPTAALRRETWPHPGATIGRAQQPSAHLLGLTDSERALIAATQNGLPLTAQPYAHVAAQLSLTSAKVRAQLAHMLHRGLIRRIGAVPNHYRLGFVANGMSVWDVDDTQVDSLGERIGALQGVSHCYRRPRYPGVWPYNLFAMLHGKNRDEVQTQANQLRDLLGAACHQHAVVYSTAILKKTGLRLTSNA